MYIGFAEVSIILLIIWFFAYKFMKKYINTLKVYYFLLLLMAIPGILLPLSRYLDMGQFNKFTIEYTILFSFLLIVSVIPWYLFDKYLSRVRRIEINEIYLKKLRSIIWIIILLSIFSIIYTLPYAILAFQMGAADVRAYIADQSLLPKSPLTTLSVGFGYLAPIDILLFYVCLLHNSLKRFAFPLALCSLSYIVTTAPAQARDGYILIPLLFIILFLVFRSSLPKESILRLRKIASIIVPVGIFFFLIITLDRFFDNSYESLNPFESLIAGTWGYFYQQPYVFDLTLQHQQYFEAFGKRFPLLTMLFDLPTIEFEHNYKFQWMFGTMFANFYSAIGWPTLIGATSFYVISWWCIIRFHIKKNNFFALMIVFSIYLLYQTSGLFYFRLANASIEILYIVILVLSLFLGKVLKVKY